MIVDVAVAGVLLLIGNIVFYRFDPYMPWWRRVLKFILILAVTAAISYYFGRTGVLIEFGIAMVPLIYIHGIWLPRHGVNGWTAEPKEKYYALRGWPLDR
jgi:uncharacterized protein YqhQ